MHLHVRVIGHQLDQQRRCRGQKSTIQHLLDSVANGEHQGDVDEGDHNVAVELAIHSCLHRPDRVGLPWQLANSHLCDGQAVSKDSQGRPRATTAERVELRLTLARGVQDLHINDRRERGHLVIEHEILQGPRLEGHQGLRSMRMGGGTHGVLLIGTDALELVESVVAELSCREEEARLQDTKGVRQWNCIEVLHLHLRDEILIMSKGDLVQVAVFTLNQEEEEILQLVRRMGNDEQTLLLRHFQPSGNGAHHVGVTLLLVNEAILAAHQAAAGTIDPARHGDERVRAVVHRIRKLPSDVVETEVHLIEREHLLRRISMRVSIDLLVAQLDGGKERILKADIHTNHGVDESVALVCLQRR
mmetsp:Transcript_70550/g.153248  ORF Transcript_70550/g.153248 Transcript_70550/m.153248 type:complete len:360 (+) Transcript_70550:2145-3224(+)